MNEGALHGLPGGWVWTRLRDIAEKINPGFPSGKHNKECRGVPHLRPMNINIKGEIELSEVKYVQPDSYDSLLKGDVLFNNTNSPKLLGKTSYIKDDTNWAYSNHMTRIRLNSSFLNSAWISYYIHSLFLSGFFKMSCTHHVNQASINSTFLSQKVPIPLPPFPEQRAIVSKIERLFSDLDNGIENFKKAQEQLKIYRQAVLKKAFEGELTKKWREEQADLPSAEELLQQIKEEREKHYQKQLDGWEQDLKEWEYEGNKGKKPTKPKKTKELFPLTEKELAVLLELPDGKFWLKLGMLTLNVEYGTSAKSKKEGKVPVLRMGNIQNNCFVWNDLVYTDDEDEINKYLLKKGDVLFNRTNSPELVGKTAIYNGEKTAIFAGYLIRINQIHSLVNPNYLNYFLNSYTAKVHGNTVKTDGVNQSNINGEKLKNYPFPYFSLLEQHQIVSEIETRLSICDKMEETMTESLQKAEVLRQSILKKAFEGKLLNEKELEEARNAPDWEPAEKLLERIRA